MAWEHLSINRPHLAYMILGGFTSLFMLCSLFIKEKLYIGEATVATLVGVIFGPHAANLFNPLEWGNTDQITLECSRIVLVVQCFAVGVELPKSYMERHWRSVVFLLIPVMTYGWLVTSLFIWWMVEPLSWLESLACAACVTATDPVLASSVVGKGKFAKRIPRHLRDILSAESGCNDGMAFPFIYIAIYLIHYRPDAKEVAFHWICYTILYECIFGAIYGFLLGYIARHAIKSAEKVGLIDRESFLVFYFVLALFCAGSGSLLGMDDLLIGFSCGVGFSNDGWFLEKTEESHVSNVIDLLLNLAYFVYLGAVIPWDQYNAPHMGLTPWRLVVIAIFVILFRRIPIMLALKPIIPDVKTWREALFAGHFGPIGVGAIFAAILARAELEDQGSEPLAVLPGPGEKNATLVSLIWPITTFMVISSILVHGSSVAVFTLGKRINTLTLTMSYTAANEDGPTWMNRLPRIATSQSKSSMRSYDSLEKPDYPPGQLPPIGAPGTFLRRQKEEESPTTGSRPSSTKPSRRRKWDAGKGPGGPVSQSAIAPQRRPEMASPVESSTSDTLAEKTDQSPEGRLEQGLDSPASDVETDERKRDDDVQVEVFDEGHTLIIEDEEGNVLEQQDTNGRSEEEKDAVIEETRRRLRDETSGEHAKHKHEAHAKNEGEEIEEEVEETAGHPFKSLREHLGKWSGFGKKKEAANTNSETTKTPAKTPAKTSAKTPQERRKRGPAHAYQFGNTIIVEDEDGEVVKKYTIPAAEKPPGGATGEGHGTVGRGLKRMGTWKGWGGANEAGSSASAAVPENAVKVPVPEGDDSDDGLRYTISKQDIRTGGRRMSKADFIKQIQQLDPKAKMEVVEDSDAPKALKEEVRREVKEEEQERPRRGRAATATGPSITRPAQAHRTGSEVMPRGRGVDMPRTGSSLGELAEALPSPRAADTLDVVQPVSSKEARESNEPREIPTHDMSASLARYGQASSAAQQRRARLASLRRADSDDDGTPRVPPSHVGGRKEVSPSSPSNQGETAAEKRRRLAALGTSKGDSDSEEDGQPRATKAGVKFADGTNPSRARDPQLPNPPLPASPSAARIQWGGETGRDGSLRGRPRRG